MVPSTHTPMEHTCERTPEDVAGTTHNVFKVIENVSVGTMNTVMQSVYE